jgi:hypothetical protein
MITKAGPLPSNVIVHYIWHLDDGEEPESHDLCEFIEPIKKSSVDAQVDVSLGCKDLSARCNSLQFLTALAPLVRRLQLSEGCNYTSGLERPQTTPSVETAKFPRLLELTFRNWNWERGLFQKAAYAPKLLRLTMQEKSIWGPLPPLDPSQLYLNLVDPKILQPSKLSAIGKRLTLLGMNGFLLDNLDDKINFDLMLPVLSKLILDDIPSLWTLTNIIETIVAPTLTSMEVHWGPAYSWRDLPGEPNLKYPPSLFKFPKLKSLTMSHMCLCNMLWLASSVSAPVLQRLAMIESDTLSEDSCKLEKHWRAIRMKGRRCLAKFIDLRLSRTTSHFEGVFLAMQFPNLESLNLNGMMSTFETVIQEKWQTRMASSPRLRNMGINPGTPFWSSARYTGIPLQLVSLDLHEGSYLYDEMRVMEALKVRLHVPFTRPVPLKWRFPRADTLVIKFVAPLVELREDTVLDLLLCGKTSLRDTHRGTFTRLVSKVKPSINTASREPKEASLPFPLVTKLVIQTIHESKTTPMFAEKTLVSGLRRTMQHRISVGHPVREIVCNFLLEKDGDKRWFDSHEIRWTTIPIGAESEYELFDEEMHGRTAACDPESRGTEPEVYSRHGIRWIDNDVACVHPL